MKLLSVLGTRPEAVKMAPLLLALRQEPEVESLVCISGQHRELADRVLAFFGISPDFDLALMEPAQELSALAARALAAIDKLLAEVRPDRVVVHGDTSTALAAAMAAFHRRIPVAHVEAGLRTYARNPFPEETNRRAIDLIADLHFAPTEGARANLIAERLHGEAFVTGNSGIDALRLVARRIDSDPALRAELDAGPPSLEPGERLVLATVHRRESHGAPFRAICAALAALASRPDVRIAFPLHPNPALRAPAEAALAAHPAIELLPPLDLPRFIRLMQRCALVLTDSGGVQEEAAALGKPVLVLRQATERNEAVMAGAARLAGTEPARIVRESAALLSGRRGLAAAPDLYGDGRASERMVDALLGRPFAEFAAPAPSGRDRLRRIG